MLTSGLLDGKILGEKTLLEIYNRAVEHIKEGKLLLHWEGEGTSASSEFTASPMEIAREARFALKTAFPLKYGRIAQTARVFFA